MVDKHQMNATYPTSNIVHREGRLMISGDLDFDTVPLLWKESYSWCVKLDALHFDLEQVTFSNSAGLALLLEWIRYAEKTGKKISFHHIPAQLDVLIKATGLPI